MLAGQLLPGGNETGLKGRQGHVLRTGVTTVLSSHTEGKSGLQQGRTLSNLNHQAESSGQLRRTLPSLHAMRVCGAASTISDVGLRWPWRVGTLLLKGSGVFPSHTTENVVDIWECRKHSLFCFPCSWLLA